MTFPLPLSFSAKLHPDNRWDITGVILVGGRSRRMGKDKAFLEFSGKTLFERVDEFAHLDRDGKSFLNINTPEEFDRLEKGFP